MAKCGFCGEEHPRELLFRHQWDEHPEEMRARSGRASGRGKQPNQQRPTPAGEGRQRGHTLSPVNAALVEFASQTLVVPNTPALTYGFLCARKHGFEGDIALFLQEVIDDFYHSRGVNYYEEVMGWNEIGESLKQAAAPPSGNGQDAAPQAGSVRR